MSDDHRIFAYGCGELCRQIKEYLKSHPNQKLKTKRRISRYRYLHHQLMKHDPTYWYLYEQGDDLNLTDGQFEMIEKLRNIPFLTGKEKYIAKRMEFEATKPQRPESWSPRLTLGLVFDSF